MKTLITMDNEVKMILRVIICSKILLLSARARALELLITFEATRTAPPPPTHTLTVATSINNNKYMYIQIQRKQISSINYFISYKTINVPETHPESPLPDQIRHGDRAPMIHRYSDTYRHTETPVFYNRCVSLVRMSQQINCSILRLLQFKTTLTYQLVGFIPDVHRVLSKYALTPFLDAY